ncbi:hypothetical protein GB882_06650 [Georgenia ruanii]|uniref:Oxygen sensor histidine kinase NreB n=2 Tax=Georgenia ruanii TaxID=348442 RepID=A0A7J9UVE5_9MICO|nr:hypothetical protein [Georgenia ruanii]
MTVAGFVCAVLAVALVVGLRRGRVPVLTGAATVLLLLGTAGTALEVGPATVAAAPWFAAYPVLMATYPDGSFVPRWSGAPAGLWAGLTVWFVATGSRVADEPWWVWLVFLTLFPTLGFQVYRYRRRLSTAERERVRWVVLGGIAEFAGFAVVFAVFGDPGDGDPLALAAANIAVLPIPVALVLGLLTPRALDVDSLLRSTVTVVVAGVVLAIVFGVALPAMGGWPAAAVLAGSTIPVALGARRTAHWLVHGRLVSPTHAARDLQARLDQITPVDDVAGVIVDQVRDSIRAVAVHLTDRGEVVASAEPFPVTWHGAQIATLWVAPRRSETALTNHDRATVAALLARAAPALRGSQALVELAEARADVLRGREEERKRLRRDLHDDLAPTLASLGLGVSAMLTLAPPDATELRRVAERVQHGIREAIDQTRRLAHGLRPAILDDHGLVEALRQRAASLGSAGIEVRLTDEVLSPVPAAVELAALLIAQEALANVARHSRARHCRIALVSHRAGVHLTIDDDGVGIDGGATHGLGLVSMRERAAELGGRTTITSPPHGGTRVSVALPAPTEAS